MKRIPIFVALSLLALTFTVRAQDDSHVAQVESLSALLNSIESKGTEISTLNTAILQAGNEVEKAELLEIAKTLQAEKTSLLRQFESVSGGVDASEFIDEEPKPFDLQTEAITILEPLFNELSKATAGPRELDALESDLQRFSSQAQKASLAVQTLDGLIAERPEGDRLRETLGSAREVWIRRRNAATNQKTVLRNQLESKLAARESVTENLRRSVTGFVRSRGVHLLLGVLAFVGVYLLIRLIHRSFARRTAERPQQERSIYSRLIDVMLHVLAFVAALVALVLVFFMTNDFLLLLLTAIFIAGLAWGGVKLVPSMLDELRIVLNLGPVREGERVIYSGLPWRIDTLGFQTDLSNPALTGGKITIPVRGLVDMQSRRYSEEERWFPCQAGEWVRLENPEVIGEVLFQTPEYVSIRLLGGTVQTLPVTAFLNRSPANLSDGYRVEIRFGIDYQHQADATGIIRDKMEQGVRERLEALIGDPESVLKVTARVLRSGDSAIDYEIQADVTGEVAPRYEELQRSLATFMIDLANENDWKIPFRQIQLHQTSA